jgi:hypothetical protein
VCVVLCVSWLFLVVVGIVAVQGDFWLVLVFFAGCWSCSCLLVRPQCCLFVLYPAVSMLCVVVVF